MSVCSVWVFRVVTLSVYVCACVCASSQALHLLWGWRPEDRTLQAGWGHVVSHPGRAWSTCVSLVVVRARGLCDRSLGARPSSSSGSLCLRGPLTSFLFHGDIHVISDVPGHVTECIPRWLHSGLNLVSSWYVCERVCECVCERACVCVSVPESSPAGLLPSGR